MFTLRCWQAEFVASVSFIPGVVVNGDELSLVSLLPAIIIASVVVTGDKLIAGVMESLITSVNYIGNNLPAVKTTPGMSLTPVYSL